MIDRLRGPERVLAMAIALAIPLGLAHISRPLGWNANDAAWLEHARLGLRAVWTTPGPFGNWRPVFGTWLWLADAASLCTPRGLGALALALWLVTGLVAFAALARLGRPRAAVAAALLVLHPGRHEQLFWVSALPDGLWVLFGLVAVAAATSPLPRTRRVAATFAACALAALSKETAVLALPLVALAPAEKSARRDAWLVSSLAFAAVWLLRLGVVAPSHYLGVAHDSFRTLYKLLLYPSRLTLPYDFARVGDLRAGDKLRIGVLAVGSLAAAALAHATWRRRSEGWARLALLFLAVGAGSWAITPHDRSVGFGACGAAAALAGLFTTADRPRATALGLACLVAIGWPLLWVDREHQWWTSQRIGRQVAAAARAWRREVGTRRFLVALGTPVSVRGAITPTLWEIDPCALELAQYGTLDGRGGPRARVAPGRRLALTLPAKEAFAATDCAPELGVRCTGAPWPVRAVVDLAELEQAVRGTAARCGPPDVRWWDGRSFRRLPAE